MGVPHLFLVQFVQPLCCLLLVLRNLLQRKTPVGARRRRVSQGPHLVKGCSPNKHCKQTFPGPFTTRWQFWGVRGLPRTARGMPIICRRKQFRYRKSNQAETPCHSGIGGPHMASDMASRASDMDSLALDMPNIGPQIQSQIWPQIQPQYSFGGTWMVEGSVLK